MGSFFSKRSVSHKQKINYGRATFILQQKDLELIQQVNIQNYNILFNLDWNIEYQQFTKHKWAEIFQRMIQSEAQVLALFYCGSKNIVKQISPVKFNVLQNLSLGKNNITNIQNLTFLYMPNLKTLRLNENNISSIKCLSKLNNKHLHTLITSWNNIVSVQYMNRIKFTNKDEIKQHNKLQMQNQSQNLDAQIVYLMKLQLKKVSSLFLHQSQLKQKYIDFLRHKRLTFNIYIYQIVIV